MLTSSRPSSPGVAKARPSSVHLLRPRRTGGVWGWRSAPTAPCSPPRVTRTPSGFGTPPPANTCAPAHLPRPHRRRPRGGVQPRRRPARQRQLRRHSPGVGLTPLDLDVEAELDDVAVLHHVILALD